MPKLNPREVREAWADMPRWRRNMTRSFLGYAVLSACIGAVNLVVVWWMRDSLIEKFAQKPGKTVGFLVTMAFVTVVCAYTTFLFMRFRREQLDWDR